MAADSEAIAILQKRCLACHGSTQAMNGLRLDQREAALQGGYSGPSIVAGSAATSKIFDRLSSEKPGYMMPPAGPRLTSAEITVLKQWIDAGAAFPSAKPVNSTAKKTAHWAFQPVVAVRPPAGAHPVDYFVRARLTRENIPPAPEADPLTLFRRLSLDLRGLPPTRDEVAEYQKNPRYEDWVDRFLASPHYGERWARPWLDLARYADSDGFEKDLPRPWAWRYRNWVIDALNADLPFDRFTIEQIAGDLLPQATLEQRVATGFHRMTLYNREAGVSRAEDRFERTINRVNTISTTWLGLTVGCAQCHDHKYDPVSQREFYQLYAFLNSAAEEDIDAPVAGELGPWLKAKPVYDRQRQALLNENGIPALQAEFESKMRRAIQNPGENVEWDFWITSCTAMVENCQKLFLLGPEKRNDRQNAIVTDYFLENRGPDLPRDKALADKVKKVREEIQALKAKLPRYTQAYVIADDPEAGPTHIAVRGDYKRPGVQVDPRPIAAAGAYEPGADPPRLAFAKWLVSNGNPLTPRVIMNRTWQEFFGRGLVKTSEDFGTQGDRPTHPELLDYLAHEFRSGGWSMKRMHRLIVTSATYKQSSNARPELKDRDPDNSLLARQSRARLSAEQIRDAALQASGLLTTTIGGPSIKPPQPASVTSLGYGGRKWEESTGPDRYRRGLYVHFQRTTPHPQLMNFDAPQGDVACSRRRNSNTALQALNLLNDPVFVEAAQALAWQMQREGLSATVERALGRPPDDTERAQLAKLDPLTAARVLLNLDEFLTRE